MNIISHTPKQRTDSGRSKSFMLAAGVVCSTLLTLSVFDDLSALIPYHRSVEENEIVHTFRFYDNTNETEAIGSPKYIAVVTYLGLPHSQSDGEVAREVDAIIDKYVDPLINSNAAEYDYEMNFISGIRLYATVPKTNSGIPTVVCLSGPLFAFVVVVA